MRKRQEVKNESKKNEEIVPEEGNNFCINIKYL